MAVCFLWCIAGVKVFNIKGEIMSVLVNRILWEACQFEEIKGKDYPTKEQMEEWMINRMLHDDEKYDPTFDPRALDPALKENAKFVDGVKKMPLASKPTKLASKPSPLASKEMPLASRPTKPAVVPPLISEDSLISKSQDEGHMPEDIQGFVKVFSADGTEYYVEPHNLKQILADSNNKL